MDPLSNIIIRPYTHRELAALYNVSTKTLRRWLVPFANEIGPRIGYYHTPAQVAIIFRVLGYP
jgi:hypothetical protein